MKRKPIVVVVSGAFDPLHIGHIRLIKEAKKLGDKLVVILNNDNWLQKKKKHIFMHQKERKEIIEAIGGVDEVILTHHPKNPSEMDVSKELLNLKPNIFANGGDRKTVRDLPEAQACQKIGCKMVFDVGKGGKVQSSSWLLAKYVNKLHHHRQIKVKKVLVEIQKNLRDSNVHLDSRLKLKVSEVMLNLMNRKRGFGLFVILGWRDKWQNYIDMPDAGQDIYTSHRINIYKLKNKENHKYDIATTVNYDGAILIDNNGDIVHSGIIIEGLKPRVVAEKLHPGHFRDLSEQFGFKEKVPSRHLSAITASYLFRGTTVFTVSEESNSFHIFEGGRVVWFTK